MSQHRVDPRAGWTNTSKLPKGPNGRALCRRCSQEVPAGRRSFCSDKCVHEWKLRTNPGYQRAQVFERDHGVCAICRLDTVQQVNQELEKIAAIKRDPNGYEAYKQAFEEAAKRLGVTVWGRRSISWNRGLWDMDHIVPVSEGGGVRDDVDPLLQLRTLCVACHKRVTAEMRRRRSKRCQSMSTAAVPAGRPPNSNSASPTRH